MNKGLDSLLEATVVGLREKSDFADRWCKYFTEECVGKLKDYAENEATCNHKCEYCEKFKWVIDRAKHYGKKLGLNWMDILASWEFNRSYWYLNYYQDCNQPEIKGDKVKVFDTIDEMFKNIGEKRFRCPSCGGISTDPYKCNTCDWKVYGLFGDLGKGTYVYCKDKLQGETIFTPIAWE